MKDKDSLLLESLYGDVSVYSEARVLLEVDYTSKFSDVSKTCYTPESVAKMLNDQKERLEITKNRPARDIKQPILTGTTVRKYHDNIEGFKNAIMAKPKTIFDVGIKSEHSTDEDTMTINTGIPALKAVIFDEEANEFQVINTCPGAGECIKNCYAMNAFYVMNDGKNLKLINRLQLLMNHPEDYEQQAFMEAERYAFEAKQSGKVLEIRWNDAGDFFSQTYFDIAISITKKLISKNYKVKSYAYTKVGKFLDLGEESGMTMTFSHGANPKEKAAAGDLSKRKVSITVPYDIFKQGFFKRTSKGQVEKTEDGKPAFIDEDAKENLKKTIVDFYNTHPSKDYAYMRNKLSVNSMKYTDEIKGLNDGGPYDVIILTSGDSDAPAQQKNVRFIFLLEH
jgi:hypothetical protein